MELLTVVIKGEFYEGKQGDPEHDPEFVHGDIVDGGAVYNFMPLYRAELENLTLQKLTPLFETVRTFADTTKEVKNNFEIMVENSKKEFTDMIKKAEEEAEEIIKNIDILESREELEANTEKGKLVDALVLKELNDSLGGLEFSVVNGKPYVKVGADAPRPFSDGDVQEIQHGKLYVNGANNTVTVKFEKEFSKIPVVAVAPASLTNGYFISARIYSSNISTQQFTTQILRWSGSGQNEYYTGYVDWVAYVTE